MDNISRRKTLSPFAVVVNDDPVQLKIVSHLVAKTGLEPRSFTSAEEAMTEMSQGFSGEVSGSVLLPSLVVTDLHMPVIDGWRFCRLLRSAEFAPLNQTPIIVVSATFAGEETGRIAADLGVDAFLPSPVDSLQFVEIVEGLLRGERKRIPLKVLIVEDSSTLASVLESVFSTHGYASEAVLTFTAATEAIATRSYDLAIIDHHLPDGRGDVLLDILHRQQPACVCLMMTTDPSPNLALDWMKRGAASYLRKPFDPKYLLEMSARVLRERNLLRVEDLLEERTRQLSGSEERFRTVADHTADWEIWVGPAGEILYMSPSCLKITGYSREEFLEDPKLLTAIIAKKDLPSYLAHELHMEQANDLVLEFRIHRKDGEERWIEHVCHPVFREDGQFMGRRASNRDITDRKLSEEMLLQSQKELQTIYSLAPVMMLLLDQSGAVLFANAAYTDFVKTLENSLSAERACGVFGCMKSSEQERCSCNLGENCRECPARLAIQDTLQNGISHKNIEFSIPGSCGQEHKEYTLLLSTALIATERKRRVLLCLHDITERKIAEETLLLREKYFHDLFENAGDAIFIEDRADRIIDVNGRACKLLGYSREELLRMHVPDLQAPEFRKPAGSVITEELARSSGIPFETVDIKKDGTRVPVEVTTVPLGRDKGELALSIVRDISDRKMAEADRERLMQAIEQSGETIIITDLQGNIEYANPAFSKITGYSPAEYLGLSTRILKSGEHDGQFYKDLWQTIEDGRTWKGVMTNRKKDGSLLTEEATISPVFDRRGKIVNFVAVKLDITKKIEAEREKALLERQYLQAQKMESIGRLAGGVAHDFNNMLAVILGYVDLELARAGVESRLLESLGEIRKAAGRSADLVRQLLTFARKQPVSPRVFDLNEAVEGMLKMIKRIVGENIEIRFDPCNERLPVMIDPSQLDQILANLCVNARDAIADTGTIVIASQQKRVCEDACGNQTSCQPKDCAVLSVTDSGCGMDENTLANIFEPFFTTKGEGLGTGLGLATVKGAVQQNGGCISVSSVSGQGSTFLICLPLCKGHGRGEEEESCQVTANTGRETILVVEDELAMVKVLRKQLEKLGYTTLCASSPQEAVAVIKAHKDEIHLLLTDVIMPGMNGFELTDSIIPLLPQIKILYMSGYSTEVIACRGSSIGEGNFIQKPFSAETLAGKIRKILDNR